MFCTKCGSKQDLGAKFCINCGLPVETIEKSNDNMFEKSVSRIDNVRNHLELLGYHVKRIGKEKAGEINVFAATHPQRYDLIILEIYPNPVLVRCNLITKTKKISKISNEVLEYLNLANEKMGVYKVYANIDEKKLVLRSEANFAGQYDKETFGAFMSQIYNDELIFRSMEDYEKLFIQP